jgi:hypothetical protein
VHIFFSVLPPLPLLGGADDGRVAAALRAACAALIAKHNVAIRAAGVAVWEVRLRVSDSSGAWRVLAELPTGGSPCASLLGLALLLLGQGAREVLGGPGAIPGCSRPMAPLAFCLGHDEG